ncbi:MAG: AAA family ATPase, partial [Minisyncoccia bacterium]
RVESLIKDLQGAAQEYFSIEDRYLDEEKEKNESARTSAKERLTVAERELQEVSGGSEGESEGMKRIEAVRQTERAVDSATSERAELSREIGRVEGALGEAKRRSAALARDPYVKVPRGDFELLRSEIATQADIASEEPSALRAALAGIQAALSAFFERFALPSDDFLADEEQTVYRLENEKEKFMERDRALGRRVEDAKKALHKAREARTAYEETGRETKARILELAETRAREESAVAREEARTREISYLFEELTRERAEVLALAGSAAFSYEKLSALPLEDRKVQEDRKKKVDRLKIRIEEAGGTGEEVRVEYENTKTRDEFLTKELGDLASAADGLETLIEDLDTELTKSFAEGLAKVNESFREFFSLMFGGGGAKLMLEEPAPTHTRKRSHDDLDEDGEEEEEADEDEERVERPGLEIQVNLPKKKLQSLMQLSGGERALTSIALIFAMSQVNPPPFLILDETDAALDEANSRRYGDMVEALAKHSQLIVITHNRETMSRAGILYGVTMGNDGISKLLSVKFEEAMHVAK